MPRTLSTIIIYYPAKSLQLLIDELLLQGSHVLLVVNGSNETYNALSIDQDKVIENFNSSNQGISKAINIAISYFMSKDFDYLFTFDQDSLIPNNYLNSMIDSYNYGKLTTPELVSLGSSIVDIKIKDISSFEFHYQINPFDFKIVSYVITSGSIFSKDSFNKVGFMNEKLFIDYVDIEWCERAINKGCKVMINTQIPLFHKLGRKHINFFGYKKNYHDNDIRVYYIIRNCIYLILSKSTRLGWKVTELRKLFPRIVAYPLLSSSKLSTVKYIFLAIKDAFLQKMGKMKYISH